MSSKLYSQGCTLLSFSSTRQNNSLVIHGKTQVHPGLEQDIVEASNFNLCLHQANWTRKTGWSKYSHSSG
ncbi:hypothetical protein WAI453_006719 [Rhynchosporium graminicola]